MISVTAGDGTSHKKARNEPAIKVKKTPAYRSWTAGADWCSFSARPPVPGSPQGGQDMDRKMAQIT